MKTLTKQARNFRPTIGRIAVALTLVSAVGSLFVTSAFGRDDRRDNRRDNNRHFERHDRNWHGPRPGVRPSYYSAPVYVPAPVYYPPQPSPGVSLFFPLNVRIR